MQRVAVGIEQVTLDQALYGSRFLQEFRQIEHHIVGILCDLHYAMKHQKKELPVAVTKEIMAEIYRDVPDTSGRNIRDAIILREYDQALQHTRSVFRHFELMP